MKNYWFLLLTAKGIKEPQAALTLFRIKINYIKNLTYVITIIISRVLISRFDKRLFINIHRLLSDLDISFKCGGPYIFGLFDSPILQISISGHKG